MSGLSHVEIYVSDLDRSVTFWGWFLPQVGFEPFQSWDEGRSWRCGETYVVFVQAEDGYRDRPFHRKEPGLNHVAFYADSSDQVRAIEAALRERGVRILYDDRGPEEIGTPSDYAVFFEDPDRIKVEVVAPDPSDDAPGER